MKYNPLDGDRAATFYDNLPENQKEGVMNLDEALRTNEKFMNFKEWFEIQDKCHKSLYKFYHLESEKENMREGWDACKKEILKILEHEIDYGNLSITKATQKIREEI